MELEHLLSEFEAIVVNSRDAAADFRKLCHLCREMMPHPVWNELAVLDVQSDLHTIEQWARMVLTKEPPGASIDAFWFGLMEEWTDEGGTGTTLYLSGAEEFDAEDDSFDWTIDPAYLPEGRHVHSEILAELARRSDEFADEEMVEDDQDEWVEESEEDFSEEEDFEDELLESVSSLISYFLTLGYAGLAVGHLCRTLDIKVLLGGATPRVVAVGFDEGDAIILGELAADGWHTTDISR